MPCLVSSFIRTLTFPSVSVQRSHDPVRQGFHHADPSLSARHSGSLCGRFLCSSIWCYHALTSGTSAVGRSCLEVRLFRGCRIRLGPKGFRETAKRYAENGTASRTDC